MVPFALAGVLMLRYGLSPAINWPILVYVAIAGLSVAILPIGRVAGYGDMIRSLIGSTAPFVIGLALAPRRVWTAVIRGAALVPVISAVVSVFTEVTGFYPMFGFSGRFQGLHSAPFLAGFCVTAVFASTLEYLREFRLRWLLLGGANLAILLATQARAPLIAVALFLLLVFVLSGPGILPLKRKVDLVMGGMVPAALLLGPALVFALERFTGEGTDTYSGRDIIWPYFLDAIEQRPLFGFGLGAGKLIVDPETRPSSCSAAAPRTTSTSAWRWTPASSAARRSSCPSSSGSGTAPAGARSADQLVLRAPWWRRCCTAASTTRLIASTAVMQFIFFARRARAGAARGGAAHRRLSRSSRRPRHAVSRLARPCRSRPCPAARLRRDVRFARPRAQAA
jgi:hypothetical protein